MDDLELLHMQKSVPLPEITTTEVHIRLVSDYMYEQGPLSMDAQSGVVKDDDSHPRGRIDA